MSVLDAENQLEFLQSNPRIATTENIPSLIYLNITGNEEIKKLTSSLLKSVVLNALLVTQFQEFEFEQEAHPSQEKKIRKIWTPPASPENIENLPLADLSLHYFFFKSGFLPDSALLGIS